MDHSGTAPVDAELRVGQATIKRLSVDEAIDLPSGCTRSTLSASRARAETSARSWTRRAPRRPSAASPCPPVFLPEDLFGGQVPIHRIDFAADRCIIAPHWLLRGVTRFTSGEQIALLGLLDALRQMPTLTHFTL